VIKTSSYLLIVFAVLSSSPSFAGGYQSGIVRKIMLGYNDVPNTVYLDGQIGGRPACATQPYWRIQDKDSEAGAKQMMAVMSAQALGLVLTITGTGECAQWPDVEDVETVTTKKQ
jgi:hypothetical protein